MKSDMINTKMPTKNAPPATPDDDGSDAADVPNPDDAATEEAQEIMDGIGDNHALCMALYTLLKDKYEGTDEEEASESPEEAKSEGDDYTMSEEGKP